MKKLVVIMFVLSLIMACTVNAKSKKNKSPKWLDNPKSVYPDQIYLVAVGEGDTRSDAQNMAAANLSKIFESKIHADENVNQRYSEITKKGKTNVSDITNVNKNVNISSSQTLLNIQYANTYTNNLGRVFALAYIDRMATSEIYQTKIEENAKNVKYFTKQSTENDDPLKIYSFLNVALIYAKQNDYLLQQLDIINGSARDLINLGYSINDLNIKFANAANNVTFSLAIKGDDNRITNIVEEMLTDMKFILGTNSVLKVEGSINFNDTDLKRNDGFKFVRYNLNIKIKDRSGNILASLNTKGREGHTTYDEAKERCIRKIQKKLQKKLKKKLLAYFDNLVIKKGE